jgi:hypothetical protein
VWHDWSYREEEEEEVRDVSPSIANKKRKACIVLDISKKAKSSTALIIPEQITKIAESASSFTSKKEGEITIKEVMDLSLECGADYGTNEHFVATQLYEFFLMNYFLWICIFVNYLLWICIYFNVQIYDNNNSDNDESAEFWDVVLGAAKLPEKYV